ncbi:class I SAM-dependent methyltransferase [Blastococcus sp. SYSU D00820]
MRTDWDHNRWYHRLLLRAVPEGAGRVLDVGCGAGDLAAALARRVPQVDAVDRSPEMVEAARRRVPPQVTLHRADVTTLDLPAGAFDAVVSMAVLHHLTLETALPRMAGWLRPGGVLAAVALPRVDLPRDLPVELAAAAAHHLLGAGLAGLRAVGGPALLAHGPEHDRMPVQDGALTTREVRAAAAALLPGVRVRRLLLWRYLLTWRRP